MPMLTRRRFLGGLVAGVAGATLAACARAIESITPSAHPSPTASPTPSAAPSPTTAPGGQPVPALRDRIGQMLVVGFRGRTPDEAAPALRDVAEHGLGGVVLFTVDQPTGGSRNVASPDQLATLVGSLSAAATGLPLFVAIDQEGGRVARLGPANGFPASRSAAELGATGDPEATREAAAVIAATLAAAGITMNLAPVLDLAVNPDNPIIGALGRSFAADPATVTAHATAFIEAHRAAGVLTAIKHFPGHGSARGDTHLGVVDVTDEWSRAELGPFENVVAAGLADAVLTAHVFNAALDAERPATLSRPTITGLLRDRIGFDGVVISDDLQMGAIRAEYGHEEAVALAIEAGVDVLLIANQVVYEPDVVVRTIDLVERLVRQGRIGEDRIDASYRRIARLKGAG